MKDTLTLLDIAKDLRVSKRSVQRLIQSGELQAISVPRKSQFKYLVPLQTYFEWKNRRFSKKEENNYLSDVDFLIKEKDTWIEWCEKGLLTGKPLSESTIKSDTYLFDYYFKILKVLSRKHKKIPAISLDSVREVLGNIDPKKFSLKSNIYKAIILFTKYLIAKGYAHKNLVNELRQLRPKRLYPPKKLFCSQEGFEKLLVAAQIKYGCQKDYDVILSTTVIATLGLTGVRASELCNLRIQDVDLIHKRIFIYLGKGKKNRHIGISNRLYDYLTKYLEVRPKSTFDNFFLTISNLTNGPVPLRKNSLFLKVKRVSRRVGLEICVHSFRRLFATIAANAGKPINIISLALGHTDLKTTQGYLMTTQDEVVKEMQGW